LLWLTLKLGAQGEGGGVSSHGTGLEDAPTRFLVSYERVFTQKFKLIEICLKMNLLVN